MLCVVAVWRWCEITWYAVAYCVMTAGWHVWCAEQKSADDGWWCGDSDILYVYALHLCYVEIISFNSLSLGPNLSCAKHANKQRATQTNIQIYTTTETHTPTNKLSSKRTGTDTDNHKLNGDPTQSNEQSSKQTSTHIHTHTHTRTQARNEQRHVINTQDHKNTNASQNTNELSSARERIHRCTCRRTNKQASKRTDFVAV